MTLFPDAATLRALVAPVVADAAAQLGSTVTVTRKTKTRQRDNSFKRGWAEHLVGVNVFIAPVTLEALRTVWGEQSLVTSEGMAPDTLDIAEGDGIIVTAGNYVGEQFVVAKADIDRIAGRLALGLTTAPEPLQ